jgi:hypothetical protein
MDSATLTTLPDDPEILKGIIGKLTREQERFCQEIELLREQIHLLIAKRFGPSSEKTAPEITPSCHCSICRNRPRSSRRRR